MSIFGTIAKGIGGFITGGPAGAALAVASDLVKPKTGSVTAATPSASINVARQITGVVPINRVPATLPGVGPVTVDSTRTSGVSLFPGGPMIGTQTTYSSPKPSPGQPCPVGYHFNRTTYYTKNGRVDKGTKCVKNRRRNPLNPRALSRSMSRITSAKRAAHFLDRIQIGPKRRRAR